MDIDNQTLTRYACAYLQNDYRLPLRKRLDNESNERRRYARCQTFKSQFNAAVTNLF